MKRRSFLVGATAALAVAPRMGRADETSLNVGFIPFDPDAVVRYARDRGYFKSSGLDPTLSPVLGAGIVVAGLLSGSYDIGTMNVGTLAAARLRGVPLLFVAPSGTATETSRDDGIFVRQNSPIRTAADLSGKTVGIFALKNMQHAVFLAWIDQHGGDSSAVNFIETPLPQAGAALEAGRVDAILWAEPFISTSQLATRVIGHYWDAIPRPAVVLGYCATEGWLSKNASTATKFGEAIHKAAIWANAHRPETAPMIASLSKMDLAVAEHMARSSYGTTLAPSVLQPGIDVMVKYKFLDKPVDASELVWRPDAKPA